MATATKTCPQCGGYGGEDASNFGDRGWYPCFKCGETGRVPADYCDHPDAEPVVIHGPFQGDDLVFGQDPCRWVFPVDGSGWILWRCQECGAEFVHEQPYRQCVNQDYYD